MKTRIVLVLVVLIGVLGCVKQSDIDKINEEIAALKTEVERLSKTIEEMEFPAITISNYSDEDCAIAPFTLTVETAGVRFVNQSGDDATFSFPHAIFEPSEFTVGAGTEKVVYLASGASDFPETDYQIMAKCFSEPLPGPFIIIPDN